MQAKRKTTKQIILNQWLRRNSTTIKLFLVIVVAGAVTFALHRFFS